MPDKSSAPRNIPDWQVEHLRVTTFHRTQPSKAPSYYWEKVVGTPPDQTSSRPKEGVQQASGIYQENRLAIRMSQEKTDWTLGVTDNDSGGPAQQLPAVGTLHDTLGILRDQIGKKWLATSPPITRLAFGGTLVKSAPSPTAAYDQLGEFLPTIAFDDPEALDFLYRINRRRESRTHGRVVLINRLTKWAIARSGKLTIEAGPDGTPRLKAGPTIPICLLELDINSTSTADLSKTIGEASLPALLDELVDLGLEIAETGDVP